MAFFKIKLELLPFPTEPNISMETALGCQGDCWPLSDYPWQDDDVVPPHYHLNESQPGHKTMVYAIGGELPKDVYESSHRFGEKA